MTKVACVGTGLVGSAWAVVFARGGCDVAMFDAAGAGAEHSARATIRRALQLLADNGLLDEVPDAIEGRIRYAATLAKAVEGVTHVQESAKEDREVKRALFREI